MKKDKLFVIILIIVLAITGLVMAHGEEDFNKAEEIIKNKISCEELGDDELEILGEYYMEQMHPGKAHEYMDRMIGGEGSDSLKQMHIQMAKRLYCNEDVGGMMGGGMMSMMPGGMMDSRIPGANTLTAGVFSNWVITILVVIILVLLIVWLIKQIQKKK